MVIPVGTSLGYMVIKSVIAPLDAKFNAHIVEDKVRFDGIHESLERLEKGQTATNDKLDRLIERFL